MFSAMRKNGTARALLAVTVALAACSGEDATTTTAETTTTTVLTTTTVATTTTTQATTTSVDEVAAAGAHYLEIVAPGNCLIEQLTAIEDSGRDADGFMDPNAWDDMVDAGLLTLYAQSSEADIAFLEALATYEWPAIVQEDVEALIEEVSASASWALAVSESQSFDEWANLWSNPPEAVAAAVVRAKLGLESNIGSDVVDCPA